MAMVFSSSPSSSSKRARSLSNSSPIASCMVDGCASDLSKCRDYYRRHKVCELHSKTAIVVVAGREQRFCQQCSRFHFLVEFDEVKRSCRKRLEGHNRRRRKPQLHSLNFGTYMTNHQASRFTSYPQIFSMAAPIIKPEEAPHGIYCSPQHLMNNRHDYEHFPVSSHGIYKDGKKFPFLHENVQAVQATEYQQPLLKTISATATATATASLRNNSKRFDRNCALSLLSSPEACSSLVNNHVQEAATGDKIPLGQPLIPAVQYDGGLRRRPSDIVSHMGFFSEMQHEQVEGVLASDAGHASFRSHGLFRIGGEGSSDGNSQTISFSWH